MHFTVSTKENTYFFQDTTRKVCHMQVEMRQKDLIRYALINNNAVF